MTFYNATQHRSFHDFYFISPVFFFSFYENHLLPSVYYLFYYLLFLPYLSSLQLQTESPLFTLCVYYFFYYLSSPCFLLYF